MYQIPVIDANDQLIETILDDTSFYLRMSWNEAGKCWTLGVQNAEGVTMLSGIGVVYGHFLLRQFRRKSLPLGDLMVVPPTLSRNLDRNAFKEGRAVLYYFTEDDIVDSGLLPYFGKL